jgi:hypothetical protein
VVERALTPEDDFRNLVHHYAIRKCFAAQNTRLSSVGVAFE